MTIIEKIFIFLFKIIKYIAAVPLKPENISIFHHFNFLP